MERLCCVLGAWLLSPDLERQGTLCSVGPGCGAVTSRTEVAINERVGRQEALRLRRRFKPLHLPLSPAGWSMRILRAIVEVVALPMLHIRQQLSLCHAVASQLVGDQDARHILQTLQQPPEEALRRPGVAAALHQDIEHDAMLIDGAPQVVQHALDPDENLIQMPFVARARPTPAQTAGEARAELQAPPPNALVGHDHAAFGQDQLDIPKAQAEDMIEPDRVADQLGRKAMTIVRVGRLPHATILAQATADRQLP
jgi:hypothetical protein